MTAVSLREVSKNFGDVKVVCGVDLEIGSGEFVVLLGPSGCGKTTTLRMIAGLEDITAGEIGIGDRVVNDVAPKDRKIAMVFQNYALYPNMTVRQNMAFALKPQKLSRAEIDHKVAEVAAILGLGELLHRKPSQLSGGQRQRVAMGRAMVRTPEVFLFDEPLSNLDAKLRTQMRLEIQKLHRALGTTVVYVTHDQVEAMTLADKIVIMRDGLIEQIGAPIEVFTRPKNVFVASFIGSPAMNLLPMQARTDGDRLVLQSATMKVPVPPRQGHQIEPGMDVLLGIRPDYIDLADEGSSPELCFEARVELVELLGVQALLDLRIGAHEVMAQVSAMRLPTPESTVRVAFDPDALHVFDAVTERAVY